MFSSALLLMLGCANEAPGRVVVFGVDGLDWGMVDRLAAEGDMPNFTRLSQSGVRGAVANTNPIMSPILWTTIASGYPGEIHGIGGWTTGHGHGYDAADVKVMRIWDVATAQGLSSLVVGWLMTFPASPIRGAIVSDRYIWSFPMNKDPDDPSLLVDRAQHEALTGLVTPAALDARLPGLIPDEDWLAAHPLAYQIEEYGSPFHPLRRDEMHVRVFEALWPESDAALGLVYVNGPDQVSHLYWPYADPEAARQMRANPNEHFLQINREVDGGGGRRAAPFSQAPITAEEVDFGARFVPDYYRTIDALLGRVLAVVDLETTTLLVCSDHGFRLSPTNPLANGGHSKAAAVLWAGRGVKAGATLPEGTVMDIAPTLYGLLGLPGAEDWTGEAQAAVFEDFREAAPVPTWILLDRSDYAVETGTRSNPQLMEQLEALGYVDGEGKPILGASRDPSH